jgi:hypothetical protein
MSAASATASKAQPLEKAAAFSVEPHMIYIPKNLGAVGVFGKLCLRMPRRLLPSPHIKVPNGC